jgi:hypothetical protein
MPANHIDSEGIPGRSAKTPVHFPEICGTRHTVGFEGCRGCVAQVWKDLRDTGHNIETTGGILISV